MNKFTALAVALLLPTLSIGADNPDESFYRNAAEGGLAEIDAGTLAQSQGSTQSVKDFGAMMVKDHGTANDKLKKIAASKSVKLPADPGLKHKGKKKLLETKSGADFDSAYIDAQIQDHEDTVKLFQQEISSGKDADAKAFASETLPTVQAHLKMARELKTGGSHAGAH